MHKSWESDLIGVEINERLGYSSIEIDESKIISHANEIFWMFGCIDRNSKKARVRCVLPKRSKNRLLALVKKYVYTNEDNLEEIYSINTRVFSDCFRSYQPANFRYMGFILKRVNHSVWFGNGLLHTNTIESLWHSIKAITNNFSGLTVEGIKKKFNSNEKDMSDYIDGWIAFVLLIRDFHRLNLNWPTRIQYLNNYLKSD